jgi:hypothetical protein
MNPKKRLSKVCLPTTMLVQQHSKSQVQGGMRNVLNQKPSIFNRESAVKSAIIHG